LTDERPDGMIRHPDGWQGTEFFDLQIVQNLLEVLLNSEIPVKEHHYKEVILSNRM
jgi:DNA primase